MKELNLLERSIVSPFINEEDKETISIYPGAFKPPHRGHLAVLEKANTVADKTIVLISSSPREDVEAEESLKIWEMYTKDMPNVEVKISERFSPVAEAYSLFKHNPEKNFNMVIGKGEVSRIDNLKKYTNAKPFDAGTFEDLSATRLRKAIREGDTETIQRFIPENISVEEYLGAFDQAPVNEIGDAGAESYEYEKERAGYMAGQGGRSYQFTTESGTEYIVELHIEEDWSDRSGDHKIMRVEFAVKKDQGEEYDHKAVVNKGELFKVMATIAKIVKETLSQIKNIKTINFTASKNDPEDTRRLKLYLAYVKKQLPGSEVEMESDVEANVYLPESVDEDLNSIAKKMRDRTIATALGSLTSNWKEINSISDIKVGDEVYDSNKHVPQGGIGRGGAFARVVQIGDDKITLQYDEDRKWKETKTKKINDFLDFFLVRGKPVNEVSTEEYIEHLENIRNDFYNRGLKDKAAKVQADIDKLIKKDKIEEDCYPENFLQDSITSFAQYMEDSGMEIVPPPRVEFVNDDEENAEGLFGKTAFYNPEENVIVLYTLGRHPKDILRSFAHEMIHHIQNLEGRLGGINTTNTNEDDYLDQIEREAYEHGNMTFRNWTDSILHESTGDSNPLKLKHIDTWHDGQYKVEAGDIEDGIKLMAQAADEAEKLAKEKQDGGIAGEAGYYRGTIAWLEKDYNTVNKYINDKFVKLTGNDEVLKRLLKNKNKPYKEAYHLEENINEVEADLGDTLVPFLKDIVDQLKKLNANSEDSEDDIEGLDKSIDYLAAALTGKSAFDINIDQTYLGRLASPGDDKVKVKENNFKLSELKDIIKSVNEEEDPLDKELKDAFKSGIASLTSNISSAVDKAEKEVEKEKKVNEELVTLLAGLALALPTVIQWIGKFGKFLAKKMGSETVEKWMSSVEKFGGTWHHYYLVGIEKALFPVFKFVEAVTYKKISASQKKKTSKLVFLLIVGIMAWVGGGGAISAFKKGHQLMGSGELGNSIVKILELGVETRPGMTLALETILESLGLAAPEIADTIATINKK